MSRFSKGERAGVGVVFGMAGVSGTGKTFGALRTARGLAADPGDDLNDPATLERVDAHIAVIDSERGRALHYAVAPGELPTPFVPRVGAKFGFFHAPIEAPFTPDAYRELITEADEMKDAAGKPRFRVIVVDSASHEWDGEGGCHDMHDEEAERLVAQALKRASRNGTPSWWDKDEQLEKVNMAAWKPAKRMHKRFVGRLLQCQAHVIICMRAEDKMRIETKKEEGSNGREFTKTTITAPKDMPPKERWQPVCEKRLPYELTASFVFTPEQPGVPIALKLQEQHTSFVRENAFLDENTGRQFAAWALGASRSDMRPNANQQKPATAAPPSKRATAGGASSPPPDDAPPINDPYSDGPPPNAVWLGVTAFDPAKPCALPLRDTMTKGDWQQWAKAFKDLTERAPSSDTARAWNAANAENLLQLKALSPAAHSAAVEFVPPDISGQKSPQGETASDSEGAQGGRGDLFETPQEQAR